MRQCQRLLVCVCFVCGGALGFGQEAADSSTTNLPASQWTAINTDGFGSSIHHWRRIRDDTRFHVPASLKDEFRIVAGQIDAESV